MEYKRKLRKDDIPINNVSDNMDKELLKQASTALNSMLGLDHFYNKPKEEDNSLKGKIQSSIRNNIFSANEAYRRTLQYDYRLHIDAINNNIGVIEDAINNAVDKGELSCRADIRKYTNPIFKKYWDEDIDYIKDTLEDLGYEVRVHPNTAVNTTSLTILWEKEVKKKESY